MSNDPAPSEAGRAALFVAVVLAVLLRVEYLRELILSPFGRHLLLDAEWYAQAARAVLEHGSSAPGQAFFRAPFYPWFLATLSRIAGHDLVVARVVQLATGVGQVWLIWRIAGLTHSARVASVAALLAASYGMFVYFEGEILTTALGTALTTAATLLVLEADRRQSFAISALAGCTLGLGAITHATALALAPVGVVWMAWSRPGFVRRALLAVTFALGVGIPVGAVTARNLAVASDPVLIASQGGINFYVGNNPQSDGKSALAPGFAEAGQVLKSDGLYRDTVEIAGKVLAERASGRELSASEINRYWYGEGWRWMRDHPKQALGHFLRKIVFFWSSCEISNNRDLDDQAARFTPILRVFLRQYAFLLPLGLFGIVRSRTRSRRQALLLGLLAIYTLAIAAFFVCARFRVPAVPWLLPFSAAGVLALFDDARRARTNTRHFALSLGLLALFAAGTNATLLTRTGIADVTSKVDAPFHRYNLAVLFEREGNLDRAIAEYRATAATGVRDPRVHLNLGNVLARTGRFEEAREQYRRVLGIAPDYGAAVRGNLGLLAAQQGDWAEAIRQFEEALALDPRHPTALVGLATAYLSAGRFDDAILAHRKALAARAGPEAVLRRSLGVAYLEAGLIGEAESESLAALRLAPDDVVAVLTLGRIYAAQGRLHEAEEMWGRARRIAPGVPAVERAIEDARALSRDG